MQKKFFQILMLHSICKLFGRPMPNACWIRPSLISPAVSARELHGISLPRSFPDLKRRKRRQKSRYSLTCYVCLQ